MFVYLLWEGPLRTLATLDKEKLCDMAASMDVNDWFARSSNPDLINDLRVLLTAGDAAGTYPLMKGHDGLHLQIIELT